MTSPDGAAARPSPASAASPTPRPSGRDLARFWDLSLAMMGVGAYQELLGRRAEDLLCVPYWEFVHPADRHAMVESGQRLIDGTDRIRSGYEARMLCRDGTYRWTRWNTRTVPQDGLLYAIGVDISDRRVTDQERTLTGTWTWRIPDESIAWSADLHTLLGVQGGQPVRVEQLLDRVLPEDRQRVRRQMQLSVAEREPYVDDFRIRADAGEVRWIHLAGRLFPGDGRPDHLQGIAVDVTGLPPVSDARSGAAEPKFPASIGSNAA
jgi:PAS domain S-box-containing protein